MTRQTRTSQPKPELERRKHKRLKVENGVFASLSPQFAIIGQITNVSKGGLAFRYVASKPRTPGAIRLNILVTDGSFSIEKLQFSSVWDLSTPDEFACGPITYRHCGVAWEKLDVSQRADIDHFMACYTVGQDRESASVPPAIHSVQ
jgi:hypothetical protein